MTGFRTLKSRLQQEEKQMGMNTTTGAAAVYRLGHEPVRVAATLSVNEVRHGD